VLAALILSSVVLVVIVFILKEIKCSLLMQIPEKMMSGESFRLNLKIATKLQILRDLNSEMFSN
jgi:hypothetical protein